MLSALSFPAPLTHLPYTGVGNKQSPSCARSCPKGWQGAVLAPLARFCGSVELHLQRFLALACSSLASTAFAADGAIHPITTHHSETFSKILLGLLLVLALIAALTWLLKRLPRHVASGKQIRLIESYPLSPRERLLLVAIGSEYILLASSSAGIHPLHVLREPLAETAHKDGGASFAAHLSQFLPSLQRGRA